MSSRFLSLLLAAAAVGSAAELRVCADPNDLPFSNQAESGFENRLAQIVARDLGDQVTFVWAPQRGAFLRKTLNADLCDAVMGVPAALDNVLVTKPYYRSTYVFLTRRDQPLQLTSLLDPRLATLRVGIHRAGEGYTPPAMALTGNGHGANLLSYSLFGAPEEPNPSSLLIAAVAHRDVDVAIVWGPLAGYFSARERTPLAVTPVSPDSYQGVPFTYSISAAVQKSNPALRDRIDAALARNCAAIRTLLESYHVPLLEFAKGESACDAESQPLRSSR